MQTISFSHLSLMLLPLIVVVHFYYKYTNDKKEIVYATIRMVLQLILIGYVLIFLFKTKDLLIGICILSFMLIISTIITLRITQNKSYKHYFIIFISTFLSSLLHLFLIIEVLRLDSFYEPRYIIPLAGMIFGNIMNVLSLCIERFEKELSRNESFIEARTISFKAAMIPQINTLLAVGLVSLPGMMTGQILSGIDPLIAVRYQIMIMVMCISSGGIALILYYKLKEKFFKY
ncbi:hypothetical protein CPU12_10335 [Malaciobacter molluscorum LMG 25693]|uniref:UPF0014 domain-containing membrane protein, putative permease n=1 Tax=Malaciobacter molluscorum LMG 25693 TaxID=870501 RepID=A0A2G1DG26_9BACT|nr:ABC transporter permease [Malaciobacter molluscorum]AXX91119.1 UPF0014 domain-containing membrane protein, putative permease [Malaciobacter molluscorum LMG 25693]PHO17435.1 hypothetical protein CPU12_10335 [Malaciobacter molluscorum LMG 25693]